MTKVASATAPKPRLGLGIPARIAILGAVFFIDKILLNHFVDFDRAQAAEGLGAFVREAQHWGFRFLVAVAAAIVLFAYVRRSELLRLSDAAMRSANIAEPSVQGSNATGMLPFTPTVRPCRGLRALPLRNSANLPMPYRLEPDPLLYNKSETHDL